MSFWANVQNFCNKFGTPTMQAGGLLMNGAMMTKAWGDAQKFGPMSMGGSIFGCGAFGGCMASPFNPYSMSFGMGMSSYVNPFAMSNMAFGTQCNPAFDLGFASLGSTAYANTFSLPSFTEGESFVDRYQKAQEKAEADKAAKAKKDEGSKDSQGSEQPEGTT